MCRWVPGTFWRRSAYLSVKQQYFLGCLVVEYEKTMIFRNVGNHPPYETASYAKRPDPHQHSCENLASRNMSDACDSRYTRIYDKT